MCGMESKTALEKDLFKLNRSQGRKSVLFQQNLNAFVSILPPTSNLSVMELIMNHTMYPLYTAFLSKDRTQIVFTSMEEGCGRSIENMIGMNSSKVKPSNYLRYCPKCYKEDLENLGESYWHRLPQVPGALYCPVHQALYKESSVVITDSRIDYLCADDDTCDTDLIIDDYSPEIKELNLKYIENASYLLFHNQSSKDLTFIINFYIDKLRERGFASYGGTLYMKKLLYAFTNFYPSEYLKIMQSSVDIDHNTNWLRVFVHNNNKNRSPLRHLLFLQFLGINVSELFEADHAVGKQTITYNHISLHNKDERRKKWLKIIKDHPNANRSELKRIGKGIFTWIRTYDREWYEKVTPRKKSRKQRTNVIDWEKRDEECLVLAKEAVDKLMQTKGKPIRITLGTIRRELGATRWFNNEKLVKTRQYISGITEDIESYRIRKIKWAIEEMIKSGERLTVYKIQLFAGFGGGNSDIKQTISELLQEYI